MDSVKRCPYCAEEILAVAIKCKHCGSDLSAPTPSLSRSEPSVWNRPLGGRGLIGGALLCLLVITWIASGSNEEKPSTYDVAPASASTVVPIDSPTTPDKSIAEDQPREPPKEPQPEPEPPSLSVIADSNGVLLSIQNDDAFAWNECIAKVNPQFFSSFELHFGSLAPGQSAKLAFTDFTKGDGERFNPITYKVQSVYINCDTDKGTQSWMGGV